MRFHTPYETIKNKLWRKRAAYRGLFLESSNLNQNAQIVLEDLAKYCYVRRVSNPVSRMIGTIDPLALAFAEGRRDAFNRIIYHLNLTTDQIERLANPRIENDN